MNRNRAIILAVVVVALLAWLLFRSTHDDAMLSGYIEGENLYLSTPVSGTVASVTAVEGMRVKAGQELFTIDPATLSAQGEQARANVAAAQTQIASAQATARQAAAEATAAAAEADRARRDFDRLISVSAKDPEAVAAKDLDAARAALRNADARVAAARRAADARQAQVASARAQTTQAQAGQSEVAIRVGQLSPTAPAAARVDEVFFQPGEWAPANQPIVSLLPDEKVKVRFFVPEKEVSRYRPGKKVRFSCDACAQGLEATIRYVSPTPEFTPPVIFSRDSRDRLVFMVEAYPARPADLMPGLPVDVEPLP